MQDENDKNQVHLANRKRRSFRGMAQKINSESGTKSKTDIPIDTPG